MSILSNIFDKIPPFYNNGNGGYDPFSGNPIGRVVSVGLRSRWGGTGSRPLPLAAPAPLPEPPAATQTCADGSVVLATVTCPTVQPPPPPPAPPAAERG